MAVPLLLHLPARKLSQLIIDQREEAIHRLRIAIDQARPDTVWVGTGEVLMARSSYAGTGVFKSTNAGKTWTNMGLEDSHHIGRVLIHPQDPDVVYVAAIGHNYSFNEERGLFKTTDGGETWRKTLFLADSIGAGGAARAGN